MNLLPIPGHSQYAVSMDGKTVIRIEGGKYPNKIIKQSFRVVRGKDHPNGYMFVTLLSKDAVNVLGEPYSAYCYKPMYVHRLVAMAWLMPPDNPEKTDVNHKDGDKLNNHATNLEWVTHGENIRHSYAVLGRESKRGKEHHNYGKKAAFSTRQKMADAKKGSKHPKYIGDFICNYKRYESSNSAAKELGMPAKSIYNKCMSGKYKAEGWYFLPKSA